MNFSIRALIAELTSWYAHCALAIDSTVEMLDAYFSRLCAGSSGASSEI